MPDETPQHLAARLHAEGLKTREFFRSMPEANWNHCVYSEGEKWTVREVLAHLVGAEAGMTELLEHIQAGDAGVPEDFDIDRYNQRRVDRLRNVSPDELLEQYTERRQASIHLVERMTPADLQRSGRHPWLGIATIEEIVKLLYRHNQIHQREVRKALSISPE